MKLSKIILVGLLSVQVFAQTKIKNPTLDKDPTQPMQAATKQYVDNHIFGPGNLVALTPTALGAVKGDGANSFCTTQGTVLRGFNLDGSLLCVTDQTNAGGALPSGPANQVAATPDGVAGGVLVRPLVPNDLPTVPASKLTGIILNDRLGLTSNAVGVTDIQTLSNKTLDTTNVVPGSTITGNIAGTASGITGKANPTGVLVGTTDTQTLSNKTLDTTNVVPASTVTGNIAGTASGITGKVNPAGVIVGTSDTQTLSNKTFDTTNILDAGSLTTGIVTPARLPAASSTTLGGILGGVCPTGQVVNGIQVGGAPNCVPDQTGAAGTGIQNLNGATPSSQSFTTTFNSGSSQSVATNTTTGVHSFNFPAANQQGVVSGSINNVDYEQFKTSGTSDAPSIVYNWNATFAFRNTQYGLGRVFVPAIDTVVDQLSFIMDTAPTAGYTAANPTLQVFIYDTTTSAYLVNYTMPFSQWGGAVTSGTLFFRFPSISLLASHTYRIGMETNTLGLGFPAAALAPSTNAGFTTVNTSDQSAWTSWTYQSQGLAFSLGFNSAGTITSPHTTSLQGVRVFTSTATQTAVTTPGAIPSGSPWQGGGNYGWGVRYQFASPITFNIVEFYPIVAITNTRGARISIRSVDGVQVFASGDISTLEWNTAANSQPTSLSVAPTTTIKALLNRSVTIPANTPFDVIYHAYGDTLGFAWQVKTADTISERQFYNTSAIDWIHSLPVIQIAATSVNTVWMRLWNDTAPKQVVNAASATPGVTSLNGATGPTQTFAVNTSGFAPSITTASNVHTVSIPYSGLLNVTSGTISKKDFDDFASGSRGDLPQFGLQPQQFPFKGTVNIGLGHVFTAVKDTTFDSIVFQLDTAPNAGFTTSNPRLGVLIYDNTTSSYLFQRTFTWAEWGYAITSNGGILQIKTGNITIINGHSIRVGLVTDVQGMGFPAIPSSGGAYTTTFSTDYTQWNSWAYNTYQLNYSLMLSSQLERKRVGTSAEGIRTFISTPVTVGPVPGLTSGETTSGFQGAWGTKWAPTTGFSFNVVEFYPVGQITATKKAYVGVRYIDTSSWNRWEITGATVTATEWNTAASTGTTLKVLLPQTVTIGTGQNFTVYYHAYGDLVGYMQMAKTAETVGERQYAIQANVPNNPYVTVPLGDASASTVDVYFQFYLDTSPQQTANINLTSSVTPARNSVLGTPDILLPSNIWLLQGDTINIEEYNLYFRSLVSGFWYKNANIDVGGNYGRQYQDFWRIQPGNSGIPAYATTAGTTSTLTVTLQDADFNTVLTSSTNLNFVSKASVNPIRYMAIGDSLTYDDSTKYPSQVRVTLGASTVTLVGIRSTDNNIINVEGRGGWWLAKASGSAQYFGAGNADGLDSPFMFPNGVSGANYRGNTVFWQNATTQTTAYDWQGFQRIAREWATTGPYVYDANGYPTSPITGWVVYDPTLAGGHNFQTWNGTAWVDYSNQAPGWTFDFSKYMARFASAFTGGNPTHVSIMFGANDFQTTAGTTAGIALFASSLTTMVNSIHTFDPTIKIIIATPPTGSNQDGWGVNLGVGQTSERYRRNIQEEQRRIFTDWDTSAARTANTYVVPTLAVVDPNEYSTANENTSKYNTTQVARTTNWVHPTPVGYKQLGDAISGIIQATR